MSDHEQEGGSDGAAGDLPYVVTRGAPPREHRFRPGVSGNPRGRPRGTKNFQTLLQRELDRSISATVSGRTTKVSKREAIAMRLVEKALKGDHKAIEACLKYSETPGSARDVLPPMDTDPNRDAEILAAYNQRFEEGGGHA